MIIITCLLFPEALKLFVKTEACICKTQIKNVGLHYKTQIKISFLPKKKLGPKNVDLCMKTGKVPIKHIL
jgi:hypothetical protein